jgi:putative ABC transport system permease protein
LFYIALKMLFGDTTKFITLVVGLSFSVLLIVQQASIFCGLMLRGGSEIFDTNVPIWVMDPAVDNISGSIALNESYLYRVRNVQGVEWAVPLSVQNVEVRSDTGKTASVQLVGVDEQSLLGLPHSLLEGERTAINQPGAVIISNLRTTRYGSPKVGNYIELNENRVKVVGIVGTTQSILSPPGIYTTYSRAKQILPPRSKYLSYVLVKPQPGVSEKTLIQRIHQQTGLKAMGQWELFWLTMKYLKDYTGIPINFGITIALGAIVGAAISAQTLYSFVFENRRQFGTFKAIGIRNRVLTQMVLLQSLVVGCIGFGIGCGLVSVMGLLIPKNATIAFFTPWHVVAGTFVLVISFCLLASLFSIRQVLKVDPAIVFRG